jgi:hypothetical protein
VTTYYRSIPEPSTDHIVGMTPAEYEEFLAEERDRIRAEFVAGRSPSGSLLPGPRVSPADAIKRVHEAAQKDGAA